MNISNKIEDLYVSMKKQIKLAKDKSEKAKLHQTLLEKMNALKN